MAKNDRDVYKEMQSVGIDHNARLRDVYNTQQVTRSELKPAATKKSKFVLAAIVMAVIVVVAYFAISSFSASIFSISNSSNS